MKFNDLCVNFKHLYKFSNYFVKMKNILNKYEEATQYWKTISKKIKTH